jgi:hypothetical protein
MELFLRFPDRVGNPMLSSFVLFCLYFGINPYFTKTNAEIESSCFSGIKKRVLLYVSVAGIVLGLIVFMQDIERMNRSRNTARERFFEITEKLNRHFAGCYILLQPGFSLPVQLNNPLKPLPFEFYPINVGWNTFSQLFYLQINELGAAQGYELAQNLIDRQNALVLSSINWQTLLFDYVVQKGLGPVGVETVGEGWGILLYRLYTK